MVGVCFSGIFIIVLVLSCLGFSDVFTGFLNGLSDFKR